MVTVSAADLSPRFNRLKLAAMLCATALATLVLLAPSEAVLIFSQLLTDGPLLLLWLGAAWGFGHLAILAGEKFFARRRDNPAETVELLALTTRIALGLGLLSLLILCLGLLGALNQTTALLMVLFANVPTARHAYARRQQIAAWLGGRTSASRLMLLPAMVMLGAMTLGALVIPWVLWGDEPHAYDVVEYHFQLPREWLEGGRITATPHNVFGYFPLNVEMHYLLAMTLRGGATAGMYLAQLMHASMIALTLVVLYGAIRSRESDLNRTDDNSPPLAGVREANPDPRVGGGGERLNQPGSATLRAAIAVTFAAAFPWLLMLGSVGYNEGGVLLFTTLALTWMLRRRYFLAGAFAGLAAGCKITSLPTLVALLPLLLLFDSVSRKCFEWRGIALIVLSALISFAPWMARDIALTGNPVFPIAARSLGSAHFDPGMIERFEVAHRARPDQQSFAGRFQALNEQVMSDFKFGSIRAGSVGIPLLLLLAVAAFALRVREREAWTLGLFVMVNIAIWLFSTHLQGRFLVPIIPAAALLVGGVKARAALVGAFTVSVVSLPFTFASVLTRLNAPVAHSGIAYPNIADLSPEALVKFLLSSNRPVYLLGDARAFMYPVPTARLHYRTVFDVSSTKPFKEAWLGDNVPADAIIVVAPSELERFERTYRNLPKMPGEWRGRPMFVTDPEFKAFVPIE